MVMGKALHLGVDLVLVTTALAGIHRATGYKLNTAQLTDSKTIDGVLEKYLQVGETALDYATSQMRAFPK
ncbi:hypothetical protein LPJ69_001596 [Coemansia sp. RSA 1752]|nr:hypothetical protein LPJ69_001596 [Coemansia sp. RSA 1752]